MLKEAVQRRIRFVDSIFTAKIARMSWFTRKLVTKEKIVGYYYIERMKLFYRVDYL